MRLNANDDRLPLGTTIRLDGQPVERVFELDTDEGWVGVYVTDEHGNAVQKRLYGVVTVGE